MTTDESGQAVERPSLREDYRYFRNRGYNRAISACSALIAYLWIRFAPIDRLERGGRP